MRNSGCPSTINGEFLFPFCKSAVLVVMLAAVQAEKIHISLEYNRAFEANITLTGLIDSVNWHSRPSLFGRLYCLDF